MVTTCVAYGCSYRHQKGSKIGVFRFPKDKKRRQLWIQAIRRQGWEPSSSSRVCGKHFQTGAPKSDVNHPDYVPNVFIFTGQKNTAKLYERRKKTVEKRTQLLNSRRNLPEVESAARTLMLLAQSQEMDVDINQDAENDSTQTAVEMLLTLSQGQEMDVDINQDAENESTQTAVEMLLTLAQGQEMDVDINQEAENESTRTAVEMLLTLAQEIQPEGIEEEAVVETLPFSGQGQGYEKDAELGMTNYVLECALINKTTELEELKPKVKMYEDVIKIMSIENAELQRRLRSLDKETKLLREERNMLKSLMIAQDPTERILSKLEYVKFFTGLASVEQFYWLIRLLENDTNQAMLKRETQLLIVLMKIKLNLFLSDLAFRFRVSKTTITNLMIKWIPLLSAKLQSCISWPSKRFLKKNIPSCFKHTEYKNAVAIIDCTEIRIEKPSNLLAQSQLWSNYKSHLTAKFFVASTPSGAISFVSGAYGGRSTDKEITIDSGFLENISEGDLLLADRGFFLEDYFAKKKARIAVPCYIRHKKQLTKQEIIYSKKIANVRIHIERVIKQIKRFHILKGKLTLSLVKHINNVIIVCAGLSNLSRSIVP